MSIISTPRRLSRVHHEKELHPEKFEGPLPRRREHITLIRWHRSGDGEWRYECVAAQFVSAATHGRWTVTIGDVEQEYDMTEWSVCAN